MRNILAISTIFFLAQYSSSQEDAVPKRSVKEILAERAKAVQVVTDRAVEKLTILAETSTSAAKPETIKIATDAWTSILEMDPGNEKALKFFGAIGRSPKSEQVIKRLVWTNGETTYKYLSNGDWVQEYNGSKVIMEETYRDDYVIEFENKGSKNRIYWNSRYVTGDGVNWRLQIGKWVQ